MTLPEIEGDPAAGDPQGIRELSYGHATIAKTLRERAETARGGLVPLEASIGYAVTGMYDVVTAQAEKVERAAATHDQLAQLLLAYADDIDHLQSEALRLRGRAEEEYDDLWMLRRRALQSAEGSSQYATLSWNEVAPLGSYAGDAAQIERWQLAIDDYRATARHFNQLFIERDHLDRDAARRIREVDLAVALFSAARRGSVDGRLTATALWAGDQRSVTAEGLAALSNPDRIREAWNSLGSKRRAELLAASPMIIGNLDGIPLLDRVEANRLNVTEEIGVRQQSILRLQAQLDDPDAWAAKHPRDAEEARAALLARILTERRAMDGFRALLDQRITWYDESGIAHVDQGARVVVFDPAQHAIATYHGAVDTQTRDVPGWLRNVAVFVPGTGTEMDDFADGRAGDLAKAAGRDTGMFVWAGGPFPQGGEAVNAGFSQNLAPKLLSFVEGVAMPDGASVTMIGHSYGSAIVGVAEAHGLQADRVLYVAGAGIGLGNTSVADFPGDADHYAIMARRDFIVGNSQGVYREDWGIGHGPSPLDDPSVTRLETGWVTAGDPGSGGLDNYDNPDSRTAAGIDSHNTVFKLGSTSFDNIVGVIVGGGVEKFAPDEVRVVGGTTVSIDGINRDGYTPTRLSVR
ncbi:MAG TPA: alpha/beta hydrolase [Microbacteriaceae bacterium]|nr:alpha/beta hydrolase [Microbacteriaceae bacterium]HQZ48735.1 alpha/beta hydrolase [Microbacteriaceae bacterium]HRA09836.1 alpha/beta hydrolase [Microbacteriaceae bacterium]